MTITFHAPLTHVHLERTSILRALDDWWHRLKDSGGEMKVYSCERGHLTAATPDAVVGSCHCHAALSLICAIEQEPAV